MLLAKTSFTGDRLIDALFTIDRPVIIIQPISKPLKIMGVGQLLNAVTEAAASFTTLNSLNFPISPSNRAAMLTSNLTLRLIKSFPFKGENLSGFDCNRLAIL